MRSSTSGCSAQKSSEQVRKKGNRVILRAAQADRALERRSAHLGQDFIVPGQQRFGMRQKFLSGGRQPHARTAAMQQRLADHVFKPVHLHAERRLRAPDLHRRQADRAGSRHDDKVLEQGQIQQAACHQSNRYPNEIISICLIGQGPVPVETTNPKG
jgi:hypothetical protein